MTKNNISNLEASWVQGIHAFKSKRGLKIWGKLELDSFFANGFEHILSNTSSGHKGEQCSYNSEEKGKGEQGDKGRGAKRNGRERTGGERRKMRNEMNKTEEKQT